MKRNMARKRQLDENKQARKQKIVKKVYGYSAEDHLWMEQPHRLSKGKIHCSCEMCASKTSGAGKVYVHGWKPSDKKKMIDISEQVMEEYKEVYIKLAK